jgi:hypothetical protein
MIGLSICSASQNWLKGNQQELIAKIHGFQDIDVLLTHNPLIVIQHVF